MKVDKPKEDFLTEQGFRPNNKRMLFYNENSRKVISREAIEDHNLHWLEKCVNETHQNWKFYTNGVIADDLKSEIISEIMGENRE
ncbi:MAG: hypothetical protein CMF50_10310 [Legionellales bacterium]|nr:hypothetical protein [Legionellales bacterium]|tara:strand:- start:3681 stop:3935 length:255 start_codon:yes stop_codon:yes gene_type:complete